MASRCPNKCLRISSLVAAIAAVVVAGRLVAVADADEQAREYIYLGGRVISTVDTAMTPTPTATATQPTPTPTVPPPPQGDALLVCGVTGANMDADDAAVRDRLVALGYT